MNSEWLLPFIWRYRWVWVIGLFLGGGGAYTATRFLPGLYESTAVVYAAGSDRDDPLQEINQDNTLVLLQLLESSFLRERVTRTFDLPAHYRIDTTTREGEAALIDLYNNRIGFKRTLYKSVLISVKDEDPEFAARLANGIAQLVNPVKKEIIAGTLQDHEDLMPAAYLVSKAIPGNDPVYPRTLLLTLTGAVLMCLLALGILLVFRR